MNLFLSLKEAGIVVGCVLGCVLKNCLSFIILSKYEHFYFKIKLMHPSCRTKEKGFRQKSKLTIGDGSQRKVDYWSRLVSCRPSMHNIPSGSLSSLATGKGVLLVVSAEIVVLVDALVSLSVEGSRWSDHFLISDDYVLYIFYSEVRY